CDTDIDGDEVNSGLDCNDYDPSLTELSTWYGDADQDGYGDPAVSMTACALEPSAGYVANDDDNCPGLSSEDLTDADGDGLGDVCDSDFETPTPETETPETATPETETPETATPETETPETETPETATPETETPETETPETETPETETPETETPETATPSPRPSDAPEETPTGTPDPNVGGGCSCNTEESTPGASGLLLLLGMGLLRRRARR
ncbi:MAG: MYXO-CTERM sorting domain-containing protein, partial [Myxococcota bacterium]